MDSLMMRAALDYAGRGWPVLPTWWIEEGRCACGNPLCPNPGKHPIGKLVRNGVKDASSDPEVVRSWWFEHPQANIGMATGHRSGLMVVDLDLKGEDDGSWNLEHWAASAGVEIPPTLCGETGSGGRHLFFQWVDGVKNLNPWLDGVDIRNDDGYVLLAPSSHVSGGVYRWLSPAGTEPAPVPVAMANELRAAKSKRRRGAAGGPGGEGPAFDYRDAVRYGPQAGSRDAFFNARAYELRMGHVPWDEAEEDFRRLFALTPQPSDRTPFTWDDALAKLRRVWAEIVPEPVVDISVLQKIRDQALAVRPGEVGGGGVTELAGQDEHYTDWGNGERMARYFGNVIRFSATHGWFVWDGKHWAPDLTGRMHRGAALVCRRMLAEADEMPVKTEAELEAREKLRKWAHSSENTTRLEAMIKYASKQAIVQLLPEDMDRNPYLLSVQNGTIDLRDGSLRPHLPSDYITKLSPVTYDPDARSEKWERYLDDVTGGDVELQMYLQRAAGYTLTGSTEEEVFFIIYGPKASGKSTLVEALSCVLGPMAMLTQAETLTQTKRTGNSTPRDELAAMLGKRMVSTVEIPDGSRMAESLVKQMTGGDKIAARELYRARFEFHPIFKLWVATNHAPRINDDAIWRRIKRVPFPRTVPPEARDLSLKRDVKNPLSDVAKAVLAWAVKGSIAWQAVGLGSCGVIDADTAEYERSQNTLGLFAEEALDLSDPSATVLSRDLYERYVQWSGEGNEHHAMTLTAFGRLITEKVPGISKVVTSSGRPVQPTTYRGVSLRQRSLYGLPMSSNGTTQTSFLN